MIIGLVNVADDVPASFSVSESQYHESLYIELDGTIDGQETGLPGSDQNIASSNGNSSDTLERLDSTISSGNELQMPKRARYNSSLHEQLLKEERAKLHNLPTQQHKHVMNLLYHPQLELLSPDVSQVSQLRLPYFTIGSCQSLRSFRDILQCARAHPNQYPPSGQVLSCEERFKVICGLEETAALCILLKRYHLVKLFEEELETFHDKNAMTVETPASFMEMRPTKSGNPAVRREAALTDAVLKKQRPELLAGPPNTKRVARK